MKEDAATGRERSSVPLFEHKVHKTHCRHDLGCMCVCACESEGLRESDCVCMRYSYPPTHTYDSRAHMVWVAGAVEDEKLCVYVIFIYVHSTHTYIQLMRENGFGGGARR